MEQVSKISAKDSLLGPVAYSGQLNGKAAVGTTKQWEVVKPHFHQLATVYYEKDFPSSFRGISVKVLNINEIDSSKLKFEILEGGKKNDGSHLTSDQKQRLKTILEAFKKGLEGRNGTEDELPPLEEIPHDESCSMDTEVEKESSLAQKLKGSEGHREQLNRLLMARDTEVRILRDGIGELEDKLQKAQQNGNEIKELQQEIQRKKDKLEEALKERKSLELELKKANAKNEELTKQIKKLEERLKHLEELPQVEKALEKTREELVELKNTRSQLEQANLEKDKRLEELPQLKGELEKARQEQGLLQKEHSNLEQKANELQEQKYRLEQLVESKEKELKELSDVNLRLEKAKRKLLQIKQEKAKLESAAKEHEKSREEAIELGKKIKRLEVKVEEQELLKGKLEQQNLRVNNLEKELTEENQRLRDELNRLTENLEKKVKTVELNDVSVVIEEEPKATPSVPTTSPLNNSAEEAWEGYANQTQGAKEGELLKMIQNMTQFLKEKESAIEKNEKTIQGLAEAKSHLMLSPRSKWNTQPKQSTSRTATPSSSAKASKKYVEEATKATNKPQLVKLVLEMIDLLKRKNQHLEEQEKMMGASDRKINNIKG